MIRLLEPVLEVEERTILLQAALNATHELITATPGNSSQGGGANAAAGQSSNRNTIGQSASSTLKNLTGSSLSTPRHSITSFTSANLPSLAAIGSRTSSAGKKQPEEV